MKLCVMTNCRSELPFLAGIGKFLAFAMRNYGESSSLCSDGALCPICKFNCLIINSINAFVRVNRDL